MVSDTFQRALILIEVERPFEALPLLNQVIEAQPDRPEAYLQRAKIRRRLGERGGAIADYTKAINLAPTAELYLARALVWLSLEQVKGAIADSRKAVALRPELAGGHRLLGKALGLLGDGPGAIAAYKQAARCYLNEKDKANAQQCLQAIEPLRLLPPLPAAVAATEKKAALANPEEFLKLIWRKYDEQRYEDALTESSWLLGHDNNVEALCLRGMAAAQLGKNQQAVEDFARAMKLAPQDPNVRFRRGQMRLLLADAYGAVEEFSRLLKEVGPETRFFVQRAQSYRQMNELEKAFKDYANALAAETENAELYELRAEVQQAMGEREGAVADYRQAATLWLNQGKWKEHQKVVEAARLLAEHPKTSSSKSAVVPIKSFLRHMPVVEVLLDGIATFDIVIDRNAPHSIVTQQMANRLNLELVSYRYVYLADGTPMELPIGRLRSVVVGEVIVTDVYVAIAPDKATAILGKDCFSAYSVRISGNEITFLHR